MQVSAIAENWVVTAPIQAVIRPGYEAPLPIALLEVVSEVVVLHSRTDEQRPGQENRRLPRIEG